MLILNFDSGAVVRDFLGCRNSRQGYREACGGANRELSHCRRGGLTRRSWRCLPLKSRASSKSPLEFRPRVSAVVRGK